MIDVNLDAVRDYSKIAMQNGNLTILDSFHKAAEVLSNGYNNVVLSLSGGRDSDIMLDIISKVVNNFDKLHFVFFNTGLEYQATKDHIDYLEKKYNIPIEREKPHKPIPVCVAEYGQPFISKFVSECIERLQKHDFKWEDEPFEKLVEKYPKSKSDLKWWTNQYYVNTSVSRFNISQNTYLKEFIMKNPPWFKISAKCCLYAKKKVGEEYDKMFKTDLRLLGIRKAEGGVRSASYSSCWDNPIDKIHSYRPLFWYTNQDESDYDRIFQIEHSRCYREYGFTRTGCVGCPFNRKLIDDLNIIQKYEPKLYIACNNVFNDSYNYTMMYRDFQKKMKKEKHQ